MERSGFIVEDVAVYTFPDGKSVSTGAYPNDDKFIYRLDDGTEILAEEKNILLEETKTLQAMPTVVRKKMNAFYEQQGAPYNVEEYLLKAYKEHLSDTSAFRCYLLSQETVQSASSEVIVYCTTRILLPLGNGDYDEYFITRAFDKESGDVLASAELFSTDIDTVKERFLSQYMTDEDTRKVLSEDFRLEYIQFSVEGFEVVFPHETASRLGVKGNVRFAGSFTDEILSVLNAWAVPVQ